MQQFLCRLALPVVLVAAGCATSSSISNADVPEAHPRVVKQRVIATGVSQHAANRASDLYALKCGRCHKFYDPAAYSAQDWEMWLRKMSKKTKLTAEQEQTLAQYLAAARKK
jgi:hypothetical protein